MTLVMLALWVARVLSTTQGGSADLAQPSVAEGHLPFVVNVLPWQGIKSYEYHYNTGEL